MWDTKNSAREKLEPKRLEYAKEKILDLGYEIIFECPSRIEFMHKGSRVMFYPYKGWASGASIEDGRGIQNLLNQLEEVRTNEKI